jgi:uncharacterized repeat protein (TIGR01451 family)
MKKNITLITGTTMTFLLLLFAVQKSYPQGANCSAIFTYNVDSVTNTVTFTNLSTGTWAYSFWTFGDGNTSTVNNPQHVYSTSGIYLVCLTVWDSVSCQSTTCDTVVVGSLPGTGCSVTFTYQINGQSVNFFENISGNYTSISWNFGDGSTSSASNPGHTYASTGVYTVCLTVYDGANLCGIYCAVLNILPTPADTICGTIWFDNNGNGVQDPGENPVVGGNVFLYGNGFQLIATTNSQGQYQFFVTPGNYQVYYCTTPGNVFSVPAFNDSSGCAFYAFIVVAGQSACGYDFGIQQGAIITGQLFIDANNNGIYDFGEAGIPYQSVQVGSYTAISNNYGEYSITVPLGVYIVSYTPQSPYNPYPLTTPSSYTVSATVYGNVYGNNNFGLNIPPGTVNLSVSIYPGTTVTPGFPAWYYIYVNNIGAMPTGATLTMHYDPNLSYVTTNLGFASHNAATQTITWNLPTIAPGNSAYVYVKFNASTSLTIGQMTMEEVSVMPTSGTDIDLSNNTDTLHQVVTGSWDPNNKLSIRTNNNNPTEQIISSINPDQSITYVVNFQNTGTAPAVNVSIVDILSSDLVANSFQLLAMSHNGNVFRNGSNVSFVFSNIMLPDSNTNEPGSHGFVAFKVNAVNGLPAGHVISDEAAIYFDFNQPVITNYAIVTMINPLGINEHAADYQVNLYPNPSGGLININGNFTGSENMQLRLNDVTGRVIINETLKPANQSLDISGIAAGVYLLELSINQQRQVYRLVIEK